jgi:hypothetical protein
MVPALDSFGEDGCGRVYAVSLNGPVYRLATSGDCAGPSVPFAAPALSIGDATVSEGDSGTTDATFQVSLSSTTTSTVTVDYTTTDGTATAPDDYASTSGTLTFAPGETTKTITVPVVGDTVYEPDETFSVDLSNPSNATIADGHGVGTILNDDPPPFSGTPTSISVGKVKVIEGNTGTTPANFRVSLSMPMAQPVAVDYSTADRTAIAGEDYVATSGRLVFAPGQTRATVTVPVIGDTIPESNERFALVLSNPSDNAQVAGKPGIATIIDDD